MRLTYLEERERITFTGRLKGLLVIILTLFFILAAHIAFFQLGRGAYYRKVSRENSLRLIKEKPHRGLMRDRNKKTMVDNKVNLTLTYFPYRPKEIAELMKTLSTVISLSPEEARLRLKGKDVSPFEDVILKEGLTMEEVVKISEQHFRFPNVSIKEVSGRFYPQKRLASHLLGYVGFAGLEWEYNQYLEGIEGGKEIQVDSRGNLYRLLSEKKSRAGIDLILTIDSSLQEKIEEELKDEQGAIVCLNPQNGEILAMASSPDYDPAIFAEKKNKMIRALNNDNRAPLLNRAIQGHYPPGSTFKVITAGAFLEERLGTENTTFRCDGKIDLGRNFYCWEKDGHGRVNLVEALAYSCNIYFYQLGLKVGVDKLSHYARSCGLGKITGIDLSYEEKGFVPSRTWKENFFRILHQKRWYPGETALFAVGQGYLEVTPLQMASLYGAIANGGTIYKPLLVKAMTRDGKEIPLSKEEPLARLPFSPHTLAVIKQGLDEAVNSHGERTGTGAACRLEKVKVAGKTGTAQVISREGLQKEEMSFLYRDHAWFCGFAPSHQPEIVVVCLIEHGGHGASAAAPKVKKIMEFYFETIKKS